MITRRLFLKSSALIGCSAAAHPWLNTVTLASGQGDHRLVVIILRGAMDGIDVFQPYGDPNLRALRRSISVGPDEGAFDLDGYFALHPSLAELMPLWQQDQLAFAPAVSTPYRDKRSHFDGQDLLEAGTGMDVSATDRQGGWLNRLIQVVPGTTSETAYSVGSEEMLILTGQARTKSWSPDARFRMSAQAELLLDHIYHDDPLFRDAMRDAGDISAQSIALEKSRGMTAAAQSLARFAANRLNADTRIAAFSLAGWDSHSRQKAVIRKPLAQLAAAILTLRDELGANWSRTTVMAMTEFGRTIRENGTGGTDHGTGGALLMAGGNLRGGRAYGEWPGLNEKALYAGRDLMPTRDIRAYPGWAMHHLFNVSRSTIETSVFPGLDLGSDPKMFG